MAGHRASSGHRVGHSSGGHRVSGGSFRSSSGSSYRSSSSRSSSYGSSRSSGYGGYSSRRESGGGFGGGSLWGPGMYMLGRKSAHREMERRGGYYGGYNQGYGNEPYGSSGPTYTQQRQQMQRQQQQTSANAGQPAQAGTKRSGCGTVVLVFLIFLLVFMLLSTFLGQSGSTVERHKLEGVAQFNTDCVADQIGVFESGSTVKSGLKDFYDQTGIQPYVVFLTPDASLVSDADKEQWANDFYDKNIKEENGFLFVYFGESPEDGSGYISYVSGSQTNSIMDDEAIDLFWGRIDNAWSEFGRSGFDSAFSQAYSNTASTIMRVSTTGNDVLKWLLIVILAAVILGWVLRMRKEKNRREKERAEETERILNTPVEKFGDNSDELIGKYKDKTDAEKAAEKAQAEKAQEMNRELLEFVKAAAGDRVESVRISKKLKNYAVCLSSEGEITLEMEKYFHSIPGADPNAMKARRVLELNMDHPAVQKLAVARVQEPERAQAMAKVLLCQAELAAGILPADPAEYGELVCSLF